MYTLVDGVEFYDKDEVDDIVRAITGGSLPNEDGIRNELTTKIDAETAEREQADTVLRAELGARIDEETVAREAATAANKSLIDLETQSRAAVDALLSNQLAAIEQLHTTLIGPNGFVDSDGDTVKANDSGKSIRQIAHEEFYRQLITDADDVKTQLDTLKELADYLQRNPSVLTDMYNKLGITWSVDNPTDFGTFDFSTVLTATNVDDAVLELYNTFTDKIGDLAQLTTTFKDSIVGAVNELDADISSEVTARTDADTALGTRIDEEVTARTDADTALGTRIDEEVTARTDADTALGTRIDEEVGDLDSLKTTEKSSAVAAINELYDTVQQGGGDSDADTSQLEAKLNEEVTARTDADTALGTRIGQLDSLRTTAKSSTVAAINELYDAVQQGGGDSPMPTPTSNVYTFIVNSNEALAELVNNDKSKGQDYTRVLVKKGEWVFDPGLTGSEDEGYTPSSVYLNPSVSGVKEIAGEDGATITFCNMSYGIFNLFGDIYQCNIHDITFILKPYVLMPYLFGMISGIHDCSIIVDRQYPDGGVPGAPQYEALSLLGFVFYECHNIDNVSITSREYPEKPFGTCTGFAGIMLECTNVTNIVIDTKLMPQLNSSMYAPAMFTECQQLSNIDIKGHLFSLSTITTGQQPALMAFTECNSISDTSVSLDIAQESDFDTVCGLVGYIKCENVISSSVAIDASPTFQSVDNVQTIMVGGYADSKHLKFCSSAVKCTLPDGTSAQSCAIGGFIMSDSIVGAISKTQCDGSDAFGFYQCKNVIASNGVGSTSTEGKEGYGFKECTGISHCMGIEDVSSSTATFHQESCCASIGEYNPASMVSNTAAGGYNDAPVSAPGDTSNAATNCEQFSFVVDSNEKLAEWANNDRSKGQDYTSVLIKKGAWTGSKGVNLTTAGTKAVVGEPGSKLNFSNKGLYYDALPTSADYYMQCVDVNATSSTGVCFSKCIRLVNCTGTSRSDAAFRDCTHLVNCTGVGGVSNFAFDTCAYLVNCAGTGAYGFANCTNNVNNMGTVKPSG